METRLDLSKATRERLIFVLSTAKNEWKKYTDCCDDIERCKKGIEEEKKVVNRESGCSIRFFYILSGVFVLGGVIGMSSTYNGSNILLLFWVTIIALGITFFFTAYASKRVKQAAQSKIKKYEAQLPELPQKVYEAKNKFKEIFNIPLKYWDEYALTTMLQYIVNFEASDWQRVTDLYKEAEYRRMMLENAQMSLEEAKRQTEIALQTRDAARMAAFGSMLSAAGIWSIHSKL